MYITNKTKSHIWMLNNTEKIRLGAYAGKVLRKIFWGKNIVGKQITQRKNQKIYNFFNDVNIAVRLKRLLWMEHIDRSKTKITSPNNEKCTRRKKKQKYTKNKMEREI